MGKLRPQLLHHHIQLPQIPVEKVLHPLGSKGTKMIPGIAVGKIVGNGKRLFQTDLVEASHIPDAPGGVFQNGMNIGAKFRRVHSSFFPFPCPQSVFQEVLQTAFRLGVDLGRGKV